MDTSKIEVLVDLLKKHELSEIEIEKGGEKIRVAANTASVISAMPAMASAPAQQAQPTSGSNSQAASSGGLAAGQDHILSPFIGTFYEAASPGSDPFVKVGDRVSKGQILCIVEAMKLMNEIEADRDGVIVSCLVKNEEPVEVEQPLYVIQ